MKIVVDSIPEYPYDCIFCENKYCSICSISECRCELEKRNDCPYLFALEDAYGKQ